MASPAQRLETLLKTLEAEGGWVARDDLTVLAIDDSWVQRSEVTPASDGANHDR